MKSNWIVIRDRSFENGNVLLTGRRFERCHFEGCVMISHGPPQQFIECTFGRCVWRLEATFQNVQEIADLSANLLPAISRSLHRSAQAL
jgi:hypothetical protein